MANPNTPKLSDKPSEADTLHPAVLFLVNSNQRRGAEIEAMQIFQELGRRGWRTHILALESSDSGQSLDISCVGKHALAFVTLRKLRGLGKKYDLVVAYGSRTLPACALAFFGTKQMFIYRSIGSPTAWIRSRPHHARTSFLLRRSRFVVALWEDARQQFIRDFGCDENSVSVIPNLRSPDEFPIPSTIQRRQGRERFGFTDEDHVVVIVGALAPEKRVDKAILAVSRYPQLKLLVVGDGPLRVQLEALAKSEAKGRVNFAGQMDDVIVAYHASDAILLTSDTEGMPGALIEAGMTGLPMISVDVGAVRWMSKYSPLLTVLSGNSVEDIAASLKANVRQRNLENAGQFDEFSTENVVTLWEDLLRRLVRKSRSF